MAILGVGANIIECLRIAQMIERHGELFIARVYTDHEIAYCSARKAATQHYASRWAAKEAVLKALGVGQVPGIRWRDIEVRSGANDAAPPTVRFRGGAKELFESSGARRIHLTLSHCRSHAVAYAVAEGRGKG